jgi:hypothetical protein
MKINTILFLILILFGLPIHIHAQTPIFKSAVKTAAKSAFNESLENTAEKKFAQQIVKRAARKNLYIIIKEEGYKSIMDYGNKKAADKLLRTNVSFFSKKQIASQSGYSAKLSGIKQVGNYIERTTRRILITSKDQYITSKNYIKAMSSDNPPLLKLGYVKDGGKLKDNMLAVMPSNARKVIENSKNSFQAHHIIGNSTPKANEILNKFGIDINDPMNGIFLPADGESGLKGVVHVGGHTNKYYDYIESMFENCQSKDDCYAILDKIKNEIYNGKIALYSEKSNRINTVLRNKTAA